MIDLQESQEENEFTRMINDQMSSINNLNK